MPGWKVQGLVVAVLVLGLLLPSPSQATLIDRGLFDDGLGGMINLIYDDHLNVTWLGDANFGGYLSWNQAMDWAASLTVGGFDDWRLPATAQPDPSCMGYDGWISTGKGCTGSEMGHLFNVEGITAVTSGLFVNVQAFWYWSEAVHPIGYDRAIDFNFEVGAQSSIDKSFGEGAWAVRSGDVALESNVVPEPSTMLLVGSGLVGLLGWRRLRRV